MYEIIITRRASDDLDSIESNTKKRIGEKLKEYAANPHLYSRKLKHSEIGTFRFQIGDYRVIFDIEDDKLIILRVGHRKDIYK